MKVKMKVKITKKNKPWVIVSIIFILLVMIFNTIYDITVDQNDCYGIGVDSTGQLYVAKEGIIEVYNQEHTKINEIDTKYAGSRKRITIRDDEILVLIATGDYCYKRVDFAGNDLSDWIYISEEEYRSLREKSYVFETETGDVYEYNLDEFQYRILLNGDTVIYEEPMYNAVMRRLLFIMPLLMFSVVGITLYRISKDKI